MSKTTITAIFVLIIIVILIFTKDYSSNKQYATLKENAVILSFGDSLTNGFGADYGHSYPDYLQKKTGLQVINAGVNGELSSEGLLRLPQLLEQEPDLVILCHGGNDILNKLSSIELKNNLIKMIELIRASGAEVVLIGVPEFSSLGFDIHEAYEEIADEMEVILEDDSLSHIEHNRNLKSDYVHPNEKGYKHMAESIAEVLKKHNLILKAE